MNAQRNWGVMVEWPCPIPYIDHPFDSPLCVLLPSSLLHSLSRSLSLTLFGQWTDTQSILGSNYIRFTLHLHCWPRWMAWRRHSFPSQFIASTHSSNCVKCQVNEDDRKKNEENKRMHTKSWQSHWDTIEITLEHVAIFIEWPCCCCCCCCCCGGSRRCSPEETKWGKLSSCNN